VTPLVRRFIKTSFVFLLLGVLLGGYIVVAEFVVGRYPSRLLITAHVHLLLVGFLLMIVMGVATWMFPRPGKDDTRYRPGLRSRVLDHDPRHRRARLRRDRQYALAVAAVSSAHRRGRARAARRHGPVRDEHVVAGSHASGGRAALSHCRCPGPTVADRAGPLTWNGAGHDRLAGQGNLDRGGAPA
jgi:hypothetical protein